MFDYYVEDETVEYNRSDTRLYRVLMGGLLAGPVGALGGLATSFGRGHKHIKCNTLVIAYWNVETKKKELICLDDYKDFKKHEVSILVDYWREQVKINEETGRKPEGTDKAGIEPAGCMGVLIPFIFIGTFSVYEIFECLIL